MKLGAFSVSLVVKDIAVSRAFYEKLGLAVVGGDESQNWLMLANDDTVIGLFQDMLEKNTLTFCPGWNQRAEALPDYDDVRAIKQSLAEAGIPIAYEAGEDSGPGCFMVEDPDGNPILFDQHVPCPTEGPVSSGLTLTDALEKSLSWPPSILQWLLADIARV